MLYRYVPRARGLALGYALSPVARAHFAIPTRKAAYLLVEGGFTLLEAIKIASFNGARFLGEDAHIRSIQVGKQANLMLVRGNPAVNIIEIEKVEIIFKDGVGHDSENLIQSGSNQM